MAQYSSVNHKRIAENESYPAYSESKRRFEFNEGFESFFGKLAILNLYNLASDDNIKKEMKGRSIEDYEKHIVGKKKLPIKNYFRHFGSTINDSLSCVITIDSPNELKVSFKDPHSFKSCFFYRAFHPLRFMKAEIKVKQIEKSLQESNIASVCSENPLFKEGIEFGGLKYVFFSGESCESRDEGYCHITGYFFVESGWPATNRTTVQELREFIGDFGNQTDLKMNTRLKLGFTTTETCLDFNSDEKISVIEDICNGGDFIMTDGCGYIAVSILENSYYYHTNQVIFTSFLQIYSLL
jgi:hypothetical protein